MSFSNAFVRAYLASQPSEVELARRRQEKDTKTVLDLIGQQAQAARIAASGQGLYDTAKNLDVTAQKLGVPSMSSLLGPQPAATGLAGLAPIALSQGPTSGAIAGTDYKLTVPSLSPASWPDFRNNVSLIPATRPESPKYDQATMLNMVQEAVKRGASASVALPIISNYFHTQQQNARREAYLSSLTPDQRALAEATIMGIPANTVEQMYPRQSGPDHPSAGASSPASNTTAGNGQPGGLDYSGFVSMFNQTVAALLQQGMDKNTAYQQAKALAARKGFDPGWVNSL